MTIYVAVLGLRLMLGLGQVRLGQSAVIAGKLGLILSSSFQLAAIPDSAV
jgi:hypothetical protein